jgi:hypothetical protein
MILQYEPKILKIDNFLIPYKLVIVPLLFPQSFSFYLMWSAGYIYIYII